MVSVAVWVADQGGGWTGETDRGEGPRRTASRLRRHAPPGGGRGVRLTSRDRVMAYAASKRMQGHVAASSRSFGHVSWRRTL